LRLLPRLNDEVITAWEKSVHKKWQSISDDKVSPFEFLNRVIEDTMVLNSGIPHFKINETEIWKELTFQLGEDLFSSTLLSDNYIKHGVKPKHFQWSYILHSNFFALNNLLKRKKINENHYHLFGSSPNVDLSWLYLMNNPDNQTNKFSNFENKFALEEGNINTHSSFKQTRLYYLMKIAAYTRLKLFESCCDHEQETTNNCKEDYKWHLMGILKDINFIRENGFLIDYDLQNTINIYKYHSHHKEDGFAIDYAIRGFETKDNLDYIEIAGERHLYYCCLKDIFQYDGKSIDIQILFYLYLLIKNKFRGLFIQRNNKYGFDNFQRYQDTKFGFIEGTIYEKLAVRMASKYNMRENYIEKLELRITPKDTEELLKERIDRCDEYSKEKTDKYEDYLRESTDNKNNSNYFYVISFPKSKNFDWGIKDNEENEHISSAICREKKLREKIKKQAQAIHDLRCSARDTAFRIYGIDACSHEVNCRPEVFGQAFRYLSHSKSYPFLHYDHSKISLPDLRKTYHAGEDFYDIIDGLRSIDEAILFLKLRHGDRIGHGVSLGLNPEKYYNHRPHIAMPLQNALDNYAWILYCTREYEINISTSFYAHLKAVFDEYFNELYNSSKENPLIPDLSAYIQAWKLRGDNPACYSKSPADDHENKKGFIDENLNPITEWEHHNFCYRHKYKDRKQNIYNLYHRYHFDHQLKKTATAIVQIDVNDDYVKLVRQLQIMIRNLVLSKGVAIESNPSSNFLISKLDKIIELPVFQLFPVEESENDFIRLNVSVNTDDQGIFYTSLVKEYTLLAGALQNEFHSNGLRKYSGDKILNWINHLIDNSKEQCFMDSKSADFDTVACCQRSGQTSMSRLCQSLPSVEE
jgi:adenosine deaminase